jgi:hypothetical protein
MAEVLKTSDYQFSFLEKAAFVPKAHLLDHMSSPSRRGMGAVIGQDSGGKCTSLLPGHDKSGSKKANGASMAFPIDWFSKTDPSEKGNPIVPLPH